MPLFYTQLLESHSHATDKVSRYCKTLRNEQYFVLGPSFVNYAQLKDLRNQIVHEYVIDATVRVVVEVLNFAPLIAEMFAKSEEYCRTKGFI